MHILGVSCFYHDAAAALVKDGELVCSAEEERFSRKKHDYSFPRQAISFCLDFAGIKNSGLDYVVFHEKPFRKFERILKTSISTYPAGSLVFAEAIKNWFSEKLWIKEILRDHLSIPEDKILFLEHHLSHAASSFYCSPFPEAAILTIDGVGEWATGTLGIGRDNKITILKQQRFPHSLGLLYSAFTSFLGFEINEGEYKVMGMAPYGTPRFADKILEHLIHIYPDGSFALDMKYFAFSYSMRQSYSKKFEQLFGRPRELGKDFFTAQSGFPLYFGDKPSDFEKQCAENQYYADIAASIQKVTEEILLRQACFLYETTRVKKICLAGGVVLNSVANGRLLREGPFDELFIHPAPGDSGAATGAALYVHHALCKPQKRFTLENAYWGKEYSNEEIRRFLEDNKINFTCCDNPHELVNTTVETIISGKVVGWFQGRFELGPRALGNRSILADPRNANMKDIVNLKIKFRETFRPFAPVILEEELENFFETKGNKAQYPLRFMLFVLPLKANKRAHIPAVDHCGTGRVQTIREDWNPLYYQLVKTFGEKTGVPILLNTSFNLKGEPIVNSPENAYNTFRQSGLDRLVMGNFIIDKERDEKNT